jgi:CRP-like cAMP-binding protein
MDHMSPVGYLPGTAGQVAGGVRQNKLLAALPGVDRKRMERHLSLVQARAGKTLYESRTPFRYAYFPTTSIISIVHEAPDGASTEIGTVGNEGLIGVTAFLGGGPTVNRVVVQTEGQLYRVPSEILREEFNRGGVVQHLLLRYTQALLRQIAQMAVCNRRHSIDQQLCRWILQSLDRLSSEELTMTHEMLANMLGVRREGVSQAAHKLQRAGLITYRRGRITVIDRGGLEACSCECYGVVRREYDDLLGAYLLRATPFAASSANDHTSARGEVDSIGEMFSV